MLIKCEHQKEFSKNLIKMRKWTQMCEKLGSSHFFQPAFGEILLNLRRYFGNSKTTWKKKYYRVNTSNGEENILYVYSRVHALTNLCPIHIAEWKCK